MVADMNKPKATLSFDLDNEWSYLKIHGDPGWERFPSFLDVAIPRSLAVFRDLGLTITAFVVGQDAALEKNRRALRLIADEGHEIGNHSFHHNSWLQIYTREQVAEELEKAERSIIEATGKRPVGFRGPGFSLSTTVLSVLAERGYKYDTTTFPTYIGPLARAYYFLNSSLSSEERDKRNMLFGTVSDALRPLKPYLWNTKDGKLFEVPVTTIPFIRIPFHLSYIIYLSTFSEAAALAYWRFALWACRAVGVEPAVLLHPLDFLGNDDKSNLRFFPGMNISSARKLSLVRNCLRIFAEDFHVMPIAAYVEMLTVSRAVRLIDPHFGRTRTAQGSPETLDAMAE